MAGWTHCQQGVPGPQAAKQTSPRASLSKRNHASCIPPDRGVYLSPSVMRWALADSSACRIASMVLSIVVWDDDLWKRPELRSSLTLFTRWRNPSTESWVRCFVGSKSRRFSSISNVRPGSAGPDRTPAPSPGFDVFRGGPVAAVAGWK